MYMCLNFYVYVSLLTYLRLFPKPYTLNPKPETRNPYFETL